MVYPRSSQDALDPKRRLGSYQPRPCARPDDIATYLFLDEALVPRLQRNRPASWDFSDRSKWIPQVRGFVDDIVNAPGVESARRLFLFAATGTFVFVVAWLAWYWQTTVRFRNRPMMPISGAKSPRFRPRPRVLSRRSRSQITQSVKTGDLLLKLEDRDYVRPPSWPALNMTSTGIEHCARIILLPANVSNRLTQTMRKRGRRSAGRGRRSMLQSASSMSLPRKSSRPKPLSIKLWPSAISRCSILPIQKFARQSTG